VEGASMPISAFAINFEQDCSFQGCLKTPVKSSWTKQSIDELFLLEALFLN
jgi:hypothetical protein